MIKFMELCSQLGRATFGVVAIAVAVGLLVVGEFYWARILGLSGVMLTLIEIIDRLLINRDRQQ